MSTSRRRAAGATVSAFATVHWLNACNRAVGRCGQLIRRCDMVNAVSAISLPSLLCSTPRLRRQLECAAAPFKLFPVGAQPEQTMLLRAAAALPHACLS